MGQFAGAAAAEVALPGFEDVKRTPALWHFGCCKMFLLGGARAMQEYRAYIVGNDGHFLRAVDIFCEDDHTAKEKAKQLVDGHDVELWQLDRKIETFRHKPK